MLSIQVEDPTTVVNLAVIAGALALFVSPNVINFIKDLGFQWPNWLKTVASVVGGFAVAFVAVVAEGGWGVVDVTNWAGFWLPFLALLIPAWITQQVAWSNFWKATTAGEFVASIGTGHP